MVSKQEAFNTLGLKPGALPKEIERKYKELALEWHPQKHNYSALSNQKFKEISKAYATLTMPNDKKHDDMSMTEMLGLFEKAFLGDEDALSRDSDSIEDYFEEDYTDTDDSSTCVVQDVFCSIPAIVEMLAEVEARSISDSAKLQKAKQNADELIAEEEKEKRKAAKRKAKKKRRKLKKKLEKDSNPKSEEETRISPVKTSDTNASASEVEEEGLDPNSAFVAVAVSKSKVATQVQPKKDNKHPCTNGSEEGVQDIHPHVLQSRELAIRGNMMANIGEFQSAIGLFMDAIKLDPNEFKYFCNRSYCYHQLSQFDRALKDAERAIVLQPTWPKGYFRKGQALTGLQRYAEAESCFRKVIALDKNCNEAIQELKRTQTCQLMEMGFNLHQAERALEEHVNLQEATEALLSGAYPLSLSTKCTTNGHNLSLGQQQQNFEDDDADDDIYISDEEDRLPISPSVCQMYNAAVGSATSPARASASTSTPLRTIAHLPAPTKSQIAASAKAGLSGFKMDVRNPEGKTSLWVGNVKPEVTEKMLNNLFSKYGTLHSIRLLPDKRCAFVNYRDKIAAGKAMDSLQGYECCGESFLIRFPDNSHAFGQPFVMKKKG